MLTNCKFLLRSCGRTIKVMSTKKAELEKFAPKVTNVAEYKRLIEEHVEVSGVDAAVVQGKFKKIDAAARQRIWEQLFVEQNKQFNELSAFLKEVKENACFHSPWDYNDWIVGVRDEVLKRKMNNFWKDYMVKLSLGPCTSKESDLLDSEDDKDWVSFYGQNEAGAKKLGVTDKNGPTIASVEDYANAMHYFSENEDMEEDEMNENYEKIAKNTRERIWKLLFDDAGSSKNENLKVAGELLEKHRSDAAFYAPWDYNDWIVKVRDELLKRQMVDFWRDVIVKNELGPIWAKDSDYYDDMYDKTVQKFYEYAGCKAPFEVEEKE